MKYQNYIPIISGQKSRSKFGCWVHQNSSELESYNQHFGRIKMLYLTTYNLITLKCEVKYIVTGSYNLSTQYMCNLSTQKDVSNRYTQFCPFYQTIIHYFSLFIIMNYHDCITFLQDCITCHKINKFYLMSLFNEKNYFQISIFPIFILCHCQPLNPGHYICIF